ncbi:MAG: hypothetical protein ACI7YS_01175 [Flavobacterium sp.]
MKKVFLSLAVIATLTVVSCKDKAATEATETTEEMAAPVEDTTATAVEAATATEVEAVSPAN